MTTATLLPGTESRVSALIQTITDFFKTEAGLSLMKCETCGNQLRFIGNWVTAAPEVDTTLVRQIWMCPCCRSVKRRPYRLSQADRSDQDPFLTESPSLL
jgi:uncharacterized protein with PIN domain